MVYGGRRMGYKGNILFTTFLARAACVHLNCGLVMCFVCSRHASRAFGEKKNRRKRATVLRRISRDDSIFISVYSRHHIRVLYTHIKIISCKTNRCVFGAQAKKTLRGNTQPTHIRPVRWAPPPRQAHTQRQTRHLVNNM